MKIFFFYLNDFLNDFIRNEIDFLDNKKLSFNEFQRESKK